MMFKILFYSLTFFVTLLHGDALLEIGTKSSYSTKAYLSYTLAKDIDETPSMLSQRIWQSDKDSLKRFKNFDKAYWVKLKIKNRSLEQKEYYLQAENRFTYLIEFFLVKDGEIVDFKKDGISVKEKERSFNTNNLLFPLHFKPLEELEVYFKILNYNKIDIDFILRTKVSLLDHYQTYNLLEGILFGGMLLLFLYHLLLYFLLKFQIYLYYIFYIFWILLYFGGFFGFLERYFPDYIFLFHISGAFFIALILFIQMVLNLKERLPKIHRILNIFILLFLFLVLGYLFSIEVQSFLYAQIIFDSFFIVVIVYLFFVMVLVYYLALYKEDRIGKMYAFSWTFIAFLGLLLSMVYLNLLHLDFRIDYIFQSMILLQQLYFSFILAYKIKENEKENLMQQRLLVQQNKLASMGEMIVTIAHQWRKPLSEINVIVLDVDIDYQNKSLTQEKLEQHLNDIEALTAYLSKTIHDFMNFFNQNKRLESFYLSNVLEESKKFLLISGHKNIRFRCKLSEDIELLGYKFELIQALLIVVNNAIDASLREGRTPKILLYTEVLNAHLAISIQDNGGGIDTAILSNIFSPYFSTKVHEKGQSRGLGLYILKVIIEQNMQGKVELSNAEEGAICKITIPKKMKMN